MGSSTLEPVSQWSWGFDDSASWVHPRPLSPPRTFYYWPVGKFKATLGLRNLRSDYAYPDRNHVSWPGARPSSQDGVDAISPLRAIPLRLQKLDATPGRLEVGYACVICDYSRCHGKMSLRRAIAIHSHPRDLFVKPHAYRHYPYEALESVRRALTILMVRVCTPISSGDRGPLK